ncbi:hypothetical protein M9H77_14941 [Catharanthus roseus]|uniref:Uncharacterized protein n=1 Tax=Catharanthus roseus TaxID=4058 RepID=A0ACC0BPR1_CATRO|nr:hypothetical protein M9H77_14941 [Catharanthus roseus]
MKELARLHRLLTRNITLIVHFLWLRGEPEQNPPHPWATAGSISSIERIEVTFFRHIQTRVYDQLGEEEKKNEETVKNTGSNMTSNMIRSPLNVNQLARGDVANVPVATNVQNQVARYNSSDEEKDLILAEDQNRPARRGSGRYNNNDYYGGDFKLKVDILSFYDFMRLAERNDLRESEVHQVTRYLDAKNLATKAKLMIRDRGGSRIEVERDEEEVSCGPDGEDDDYE